MKVNTREEAKEHCFLLMKEWGLDLPRELPGGYCSFVMTDGTLVLKVPFQGESQTTGLLAAERLAGVVGPLVHRTEWETGSLLMDFVAGDHLSVYGVCDEQAMPIYLDLALRVRPLDPTGLPDMSAYYQVSTDLIQRLVETTEERVFLHADLHHLNILGSESQWMAIDPLGFHGDPAFEAVAYIRNPIDALGEVQDLEGFLQERIREISAGLGVSPDRVWAWSLADRRAGSEDEGHPWTRMRAALENLADRFAI